MKILLPFDGSKNSVKAVKHVVQLAKDSKSATNITLINVHVVTGFGLGKKFSENKSATKFLKEVAEKELASAYKILETAKLQYDVVIKGGHIAQKIISQANRDKVDLIVMGAKGRSGLIDILVGSVAQQVISLSKQPVLLVK